MVQKLDCAVHVQQRIICRLQNLKKQGKGN